MSKTTMKIKSNMRKSLILAAIMLMSMGCYAQKNPAVKAVKRYIQSDTPDFNAARVSIEDALKAEPTAETYYWAGMIGYQQINQLNYNQMMGQGIDQALAGEAVTESYE